MDMPTPFSDNYRPIPRNLMWEKQLKVIELLAALDLLSNHIINPAT